MDCNKRKGFTLVELLVVVSIIALLMAIIVPSLRMARSQAEKSVCVSNLHTMYIAYAVYADNHNQELPQTSSNVMSYNWDIEVADMMAKYVSGEYEAFYCPSVLKVWKRKDTSGQWMGGCDGTAESQWFNEWANSCNMRRVGYLNTMTPAAEGNPSGGGVRTYEGKDYRIRRMTDRAIGPMLFDQTVNVTTRPFSDKDWTHPWSIAAHSLRQDHRPRGGNVGFLDGSTYWRRFDDMKPRMTYDTGAGYRNQWF